MAGGRVKYISIVDPKRLQHYTHRNPPWIKLYRDLFTDPRFSRLTDAAKLQYVFLQTLVPECDNKIPWDDDWLKRRIGSGADLKVKELERLGFIHISNGNPKPPKKGSL